MTNAPSPEPTRSGFTLVVVAAFIIATALIRMCTERLRGTPFGLAGRPGRWDLSTSPAPSFVAQRRRSVAAVIGLVVATASLVFLAK